MCDKATDCTVCDHYSDCPDAITYDGRVDGPDFELRVDCDGECGICDDYAACTGLHDGPDACDCASPNCWACCPDQSDYEG